MTVRVIACGLAAGVLNLLLSHSAAQAAPQRIFAIAQQQPNNVAEAPGAPADTILLYDVTDIGAPGASGVFNNTPLFSVWLGYEIFEGEADNTPQGVPRGNREDTSALTFNPANGTMYALAFDSGTTAVPDPVGDVQGDYDLYRIDYQELLNDFITNSRPVGTIYAPPTQRTPTGNEQFLADIASPLFDGVVDGIAHNIPHPSVGSTTVFIPNAIEKIGEVGRSQGGGMFFDTEFSFIDPETFVFLDNASAANPGTQDSDFQIRSVQRVSTTPGMAMMDADGPDNVAGTNDDYQGGFNGNSIQSWESYTLARLQLDAADHSEPGGWALVKRDGKIGLWVADNEGAGGGDEVAYFELDFSGPTATATRKLLPTSNPGSFTFRVDEQPAVDGTTNNGEIDQLLIDKNGNLVVVESGFFDTIAGSTTPPTGSGGLTAQQPRAFTVDIETYNNANGPLPEGYTASGGTTTFDSASPWTVHGTMNPTATDDTQVLNSTRVAYDRSTGYIYVIEQDADFFEDIYVFDPATGQIIYEELNAFNPGLFNTGTQIVFTRGDINGDGVVNQSDISALQAGIADPTLGGTVSAAVGTEWYDLTGDGLLNAADLTVLQGIVGAPLAGDFDGDGDVDGADLADWRMQYGSGPGADADGDGDSDGNDFLVWQRNLSAGATTAAAAAIPEPASACLLTVAGLSFAAVRRRG
jgi:hypothetical protein